MKRPKNLRGTVILLGLAALAPWIVAQAAEPPPEAAAAMRWTDPDGKPLPFRSDEELLEFLRTAEVKKEKTLTGGVTFPLKLLLEKDGVRANAVFRDVSEDKPIASFGSGGSELAFRDSYLFEPAAYQLSLMLGMDNVPPATLRKYRSKSGSIQIWVEHTITESERLKEGRKAPDEQRWMKQVQMMNVFDALVYNTDRNRGNILITPDWKLWMIDHTRAFRRHKSLQKPEGLVQCERHLFERLEALDGAEVHQRLSDYLRRSEIDALLKRRDLIVERLKTLISQRGEHAVLYDR